MGGRWQVAALPSGRSLPTRRCGGGGVGLQVQQGRRCGHGRVARWQGRARKGRGRQAGCAAARRLNELVDRWPLRSVLFRSGAQPGMTAGCCCSCRPCHAAWPGSLAVFRHYVPALATLPPLHAGRACRYGSYEVGDVAPLAAHSSSPSVVGTACPLCDSGHAAAYTKCCCWLAAVFTAVAAGTHPGRGRGAGSTGGGAWGTWLAAIHH